MFVPVCRIQHICWGVWEDALQKRFAARTYLLGLIAVAVIPVWIFAAYVLLSLALSQQQVFKDRAVQLARQSAIVVDGVLNDLKSELLRLAGSIEARAGSTIDGPSAMRLQGARYRYRLQEIDGTLVFDTADTPGGRDRRARVVTPAEMQSMRAHGHAISDVYSDPATGSPVVDLSVPITASTPLHLIVTVPTSVFGDALRANLPPDWIVGVADTRDVYVARSQRHDEVSGTPGLPEYIAKAVGTSGSFTSSNQFGDTLLAGYYRSPRTHWLFAANVQLATVEAPLRRSLLGILGMGAVALGVSLSLAYFVGRSLTMETSRLVDGALALGSREPVKPVRTRLREFALVSDALIKAEGMLSEQTSQLSAVVETAPVAVWFTYDPKGREVIRNRYAAELMGLPSDGRPHFGVPDQVTETIALKDGKEVSRDDRPLTRAMRGELTDQEEFSYILPNGNERSLITSARPIVGRSGNIIGAVQISVDITQRKRDEEQRNLLMNELNHRVKNNLAIVQAVAQQTMRSASSLEEAGPKLTGRLAALAQGHDILTSNSWSEGGLVDVINRTVVAQAERGRVSIQGDDLLLTPDLVMALTLTLHELMTNAAKYGSLSSERGMISIAWDVDPEIGDLQITWTETGGPRVAAPARHGFGTRLISRTIEAQSGKVVRTYLSEGLQVEISLPWTGNTVDG